MPSQQKPASPLDALGSMPALPSAWESMPVQQDLGRPLEPGHRWPLTAYHSAGCDAALALFEAFDAKCDRLTAVQAALAASDAALVEARRERDEARGDLDSMNLRREVFKVERDEARDALAAETARADEAHDARMEEAHLKTLALEEGDALRHDLAAANERARVAEAALVAWKDMARQGWNRVKTHASGCDCTFCSFVARERVAAPADAPVAAPRDNCPTCDSPKPHLHPSVQEGGEGTICPDAFHRTVTAQNTPKRIAEADALAARIAAPAPVVTPGERAPGFDMMAAVKAALAPVPPVAAEPAPKESK